MMTKEVQIEFTERENHPGALVEFIQTSEFIEIIDTDGLKLRVYALSPDIFRFRYSIEGHFEDDFSYALDSKMPFNNIPIEVSETPISLILKIPHLKCEISKIDLRKKIYNAEGFLLNEDEKGFHWEKNKNNGGYIVQMSKYATKDEAYYGLGDKPTDLNLRGKRLLNWGTDEYGYSAHTDPLYKSIPIYYGLKQGVGYGVFFDNSYKAYFDFAKERKEITSFWAQGGEMNYYFIYGPSLMSVCEQYTKMTGVPDMPPLWSLGFQQCKWSYYPESQVMDVAHKMREYQIPCDAIYLDIDYMDGFRCFTWDLEKFPEPKKMVDNLKNIGFKTMVIIDPGIKRDKDYDIFIEGLEKGYFCKRSSGYHIEGKVWPGECFFPDFTRPEVREWWAGLYKGLIENIGIAGVWNDMNEPALFEVPSKTFPMDVIHDYDGHQTNHLKAHNVYGMQMARATYEGVKRFKHGDRALIITRSGYSGMQRYSSVWTGDNIANWEHIWVADVQSQRLAISGVSFCGSDIGGFINQPTPELMIRWIQLGIFHPFCRVHSSGDHGDQEPWSFGEACLQIFKQYIELRYQLLMYHYTTFYQYVSQGTPMLRPIVFEDQADSETHNRDHEFLCGDHMLICPVIKPGKKTRKLYLPKGSWINYWTNEKLDGGHEVEVDTPVDQIPWFIRAGAIIPTIPVQQYVGEKNIDSMTLNVYYGNSETISCLYQDDQNTYNYENGDSVISEFKVSVKDNRYIIEHKFDGSYQGVSTFNIKLIGFPAGIQNVVIDGHAASLDEDVSFDFKHIEFII